MTRRIQPARGTAKKEDRKKTLVGATGFEPATSSSRTKRATKLRHAPTVAAEYMRSEAVLKRK